MTYRVTPLDGRSVHWSGLNDQEAAQITKQSISALHYALQYGKGKAEFPPHAGAGSYRVEDESAISKK